jgi:hypothetical protein
VGPQEEARERQAAEHHARAVDLHLAGLEEAQPRAREPDERGRELGEDAVDDPLVGDHGGVRELVDGAEDGGVVELVDAPLVEHQPVQPRHARGERPRRLALLQHVGVVGEADADHRGQEPRHRQHPGVPGLERRHDDVALGRGEDGREPVLERRQRVRVQRLAQDGRVQEARADREGRQDDERDRHRQGRLVRVGPLEVRGARARGVRLVVAVVVVAVVVVAVAVVLPGGDDLPALEVAPEGQKIRAEHVERRHRRAGDAHRVERRAEPVWRRPERADALGREADHLVGLDRALVGLRQNFVFREEAGEGRHARDGDARGEVRPVGERHVLAQPAHVAHVLRGVGVVHARVHRVNDAAGAEEEAGLEEGVREDVEEAVGERARPDAEEHVAELADGRVGQHLLQIVLHEPDGGGEERRQRADRGDGGHHGGREHEDEVEAADEVDARGDHGGGVDERRDRRRAGHGVGQPHVEGYLRALAGAAQEEREAAERRGVDEAGAGQPALDAVGQPADEPGREAGAERPDLHAALVEQPVRAAADALEVERAGVIEQHRHGDEEAEVADAVGDEGLLARGRVLLFGEPEADEQVAAEADALPADEEQRHAVAQDEHQHREDEQVQVTKEAVERGVVPHVRGRVEVNERADPGDDEHHRARQRVDGERDVDIHRADAVAAREGEPLPGRPDEARVGDRLAVAAADLVRVLAQHQEGDEGGGERAEERGERHQPHAVAAEPLAEDAVDEGADQRQPEDDGDEGELLLGEDGEQGLHRSGPLSPAAGRPRRCAPSDGAGRSRARWRGRRPPRRPRRR